MSQKVARPNPLALRLALFGALLMLAGCFQPAGNDLQPTTVDLLSLTAIVSETPTLPPTPIVAATASPTVAPTTPVLPTDTVDAPTPPAEPTEQPQPLVAAESPTPFEMFPSPTLPPDSPFASTVTPGSPEALAAPTTPAAPGLLPTPTALPTNDPCFYIVQPGEWPYAIARKLQIDAQALIAANPAIASGQLQPGDRLIVPNCTPAATPTPPPPAPAVAPTLGAQGSAATSIPVIDRVYTVADGDTLGAIARKFNTTVRELQIVNNLQEGDFIRTGQQLRIPAPSQ